METAMPITHANHACGPTASVLHRIHEHSINITEWERTSPIPSGQLIAVLEGLGAEVRAAGCVTAIQEHLRDALFDRNLAAKDLLDDVAHLLLDFARIALVKELRLSLSTVNTNMCRRFHTDVNDLRLLCTYVGPGTLWLPNDAVNEQAIRRHDHHLPIERSPEDVQQVGTGHVAILKGALYPGDPVSACVHRSPTIEETGQRRLLLRIDTNGALMDL
jgi:hypothetical protein